MDRQSSGPRTNIPVAGREYEEGGGTSSMDRFRLFRGGEGRKTLALLDCVWESRVWICLIWEPHELVRKIV